MMMTVMMIIIMMIIFMMIMIINMINSDDVHPRRADSQTLSPDMMSASMVAGFMSKPDQSQKGLDLKTNRCVPNGYEHASIGT